MALTRRRNPDLLWTPPVPDPPEQGLRTLQARCTLLGEDGMETEYSVTMDVFFGKNVFRFAGAAGTFTGYMIRFGTGRVISENFPCSYRVVPRDTMNIEFTCN